MSETDVSAGPIEQIVTEMDRIANLPTRGNAIAAIREVVETLPDAEILALGQIAKRLLLGHLRYGPVHAGKRHWPLEMLEESLDRTLYAVFDDLDRAGLLPEAP